MLQGRTESTTPRVVGLSMTPQLVSVPYRTGWAPASAVYQPPPGTKTGFSCPPLFVPCGELTASATTAARRATPARATSRWASAGLKPPRRRARQTTGGRPGRTPEAAGRRHSQTAAVGAEERRAPRRARDPGPRPRGRGGRAPRCSTHGAPGRPTAGGRQAPAAPGQLPAPAPAPPAAPTEAEAAALRARVSAAVAQGPAAQAPAPGAPAQAEVSGGARRPLPQAHLPRPARQRALAASGPRTGSGSERSSPSWTASLLRLRQVEELGDVVGRTIGPLGGRQQADVLRQLDLWSLRLRHIAFTAAGPTVPRTRLEWLQLGRSRLGGHRLRVPRRGRVRVPER